MTTSPKPYQRNIFLINKPFQLKFSLFVCSWIVALSVVYPLVIINLFDLFFRYASLDPMGPPVTKIHAAREEVLWLIVLLEVVFVAITFLISIFISHRIAGPLFKLKRTFALVKKGELNHDLHFRKKDYFHDVARDFNEMLRGLRSALSVQTAKIDESISKLEAARSKSSGETQTAIDAALASLRDAREHSLQ